MKLPQSKLAYQASFATLWRRLTRFTILNWHETVNDK